MNPDELDAARLRLADIRRRLANLRSELVTREPTFAELLERPPVGTPASTALRRKLH